jgi:hypothetical protein
MVLIHILLARDIRMHACLCKCLACSLYSVNLDRLHSYIHQKLPMQHKSLNVYCTRLFSSLYSEDILWSVTLIFRKLWPNHVRDHKAFFLVATLYRGIHNRSYKPSRYYLIGTCIWVSVVKSAWTLCMCLSSDKIDKQISTLNICHTDFITQELERLLYQAIFISLFRGYFVNDI